MAGQFVAQVDEGVFAGGFIVGGGRGLVAAFRQPAGLPGGDDFIQRGNVVTSADVACVHLVVVEVFAGKHAVFIADQAVFLHGGGVEFHLDFHVLRHGGERGGKLAVQHFLSFFWAVDVAIVAVAGIGQLLHQPFVVVAAAEAERGERNAAFAFFGHHAAQGVEIGNAHVEIAVGGEQDAVDAVADIGALGGLVGLLDGVFAGGGAACPQAVERGEDFLPLVARGGRQHDLVAVGIGNEGDAVLGAGLVREGAEGVFHHRQFVAAIHGAGHVHQEHEVGRRQRGLAHLFGLDADADQLGAAAEGGIHGFGVHGEGFAVGRLGVAVVEIVDDFFNAHGIGGRQAAGLGEEAADIGIATGVHINAEGGNGLLGHGVHGVGLIMAVALGVLARWGGRALIHHPLLAINYAI